MSKLGRDLDKVIFIDNMIENFKLNPHNGIEISSWIDNIRDTELYDIGKIVKGK